MTKECWSDDNESFCYESLGELVDNTELEVGQIVYKADAIRPDVSFMIDSDDIVTMLNERACDEYGDYAEDFPNVSDDALKELDYFLQHWINRNCDGTFYKVQNVVEYVITSEDLGE